MLLSMVGMIDLLDMCQDACSRDMYIYKMCIQSSSYHIAIQSHARYCSMCIFDPTHTYKYALDQGQHPEPSEDSEDH